LILAFLRDKLPGTIEVSIDLKVLAFTAMVSVLAGMMAGILPALHLSRANVSQSLKEGLGRTASDSSGNRTRSLLVVLEVSLSLVLLVGAGLMIRSLAILRALNPGFESHGVLTMTAAISRAKFSTASEQNSFLERVLERIRALPGVLAAGAIDDLPLSGNGSHQPIAVEGRPVVPMSEQPEVDVRAVSSGYMDALRIPLLRGRAFDNTDVAGRPATTVISASLAKQFWPSENPIGKHLTLTFFPGVVRQVIGVVGDVKADGLDQTRPEAMLYVPFSQLSPTKGEQWHSFPVSLVIRSSNPASMAPAVSNAVREVDGSIPIRDVLAMDEWVTSSLSEQRLNLSVLTAFAVLALILAALGIYSVLSYSVRRRVQEIGIRLALGATLSDVLRMIVFDGMRPTLTGVTLGTAGALALAHVMSSLLYGVRPRDPFTFLSVAVLLALVALCASVIPAYRAAKVDPVVVLRYE
jgi:predicted permease